MMLKNILVVEDSAQDLELTLAALEENNVANKIVVTRDGAEALDYLYQHGKFASRVKGHPAVVLLDIKMPKVDGLEVLRKIKGDDTMKMIPIVMLTASREEKDLVESYKLGVNGYMVKPVNFADFVRAVRDLGSFWGLINEPPPTNPRAALAMS